MGENKSSAEEGCIVSPLEIPDESISHESHIGGLIVLLGKYVEERTPVLAVFVTPSVSVARVTGVISHLRRALSYSALHRWQRKAVRRGF